MTFAPFCICTVKVNMPTKQDNKTESSGITYMHCIQCIPGAFKRLFKSTMGTRECIANNTSYYLEN